jgi:hypothetical protein
MRIGPAIGLVAYESLFNPFCCETESAFDLNVVGGLEGDGCRAEVRFVLEPRAVLKAIGYEFFVSGEGQPRAVTLPPTRTELTAPTGQGVGSL